MKVYCKNCSHNAGGFFDYDSCKEGIEYRESPIIGMVKEIKYANPYIKNKDLNCKDYKRKFWKFWIKR
jgi:hypothetical protein